MDTYVESVGRIIGREVPDRALVLVAEAEKLGRSPVDAAKRLRELDAYSDKVRAICGSRGEWAGEAESVIVDGFRDNRSPVLIADEVGKHIAKAQLASDMKTKAYRDSKLAAHRDARGREVRSSIKDHVHTFRAFNVAMWVLTGIASCGWIWAYNKEIVNGSALAIILGSMLVQAIFWAFIFTAIADLAEYATREIKEKKQADEKKPSVSPPPVV